MVPWSLAAALAFGNGGQKSGAPLGINPSVSLNAAMRAMV